VETLHRVFKGLDLAAFDHALGSWIAAASIGLTAADGIAVVAIDGKALRSHHHPTVPAFHLRGASGRELSAGLPQTSVVPDRDAGRALLAAGGTL
jgi:hypothetical protein